MKNVKKVLISAFIGVFTCVALAGCGNSGSNTKASDEPTTPETVSISTNNVPATVSDTEVEFTFVVDTSELDGGFVKETKAKAKGTLGDYVRIFDECVWEDGQYGLFVHSFYGMENDDRAGLYWSFYVNGEYSMVGADMVPLEEGATYTWKLETFS